MHKGQVAGQSAKESIYIARILWNGIASSKLSMDIKKETS
jgi:hypothetical protein